ncbi:MAG: peptide-methionine (S)-S-oxide reductase MsrA [Candidatus Acidiferrales bacterium]|jgi:peptide-methionine (S)-S-oxide reductase
MIRSFLVGLAVMVAVMAVLTMLAPSTTTAAVAIPSPAVDDTISTAKGQQTVVLAGGCFWGIQAVFEHVKGVKSVTAGYSGGTVKNPSYEQVSSGATGHAESVKIVYDPSKVTFGQLLKVFFSVAHDPTELDRQGPDNGTQYRSAVFFTSDSQQHIAKAYIDQLNSAKVYPQPIVTEVTAYSAFYPAEDYHQDFAEKNPYNTYIMMNDAPKVVNLKKDLPDLYKAH